MRVHRVSQGCFESDSKIFFSTPSYRYFLKFWSEESRPWGYIKCLKLVLNLARKKIIFTVGGPKYDFRSWLKIKLKPRQNGYHSTTFCMPYHSKWVKRPLRCHKNLTPKVIFRIFNQILKIGQTEYFWSTLDLLSY